MPRNLLALRRLVAPLPATPTKAPLSRRLVLTALVRLSLIGGVVTSPFRAFAARRQARAEPHVALTLSAIIDHMLPADALPGALALGIDRGIIAAADPELKRSLAKGVAWLDAWAKTAGAVRFLDLAEPARESALQAALGSGAEGAAAFVRTLRSLAFSRYYTHPTVMAAFAYSGPPQPEGFPDFQEPPR